MLHSTIAFQFVKHQTLQEGVPCYAVAVFEDGMALDTDPMINESIYRKVILPLLKETQFTGKASTIVSANCYHHLEKVILVGLGKKEALDQEVIRKAASDLYRVCLQLHSPTLALHCAPLKAHAGYIKAFAEGIFLAAHRDERFKSQKEQRTQLKQIDLIDIEDHIDNHKALQVAEKIASGVGLAKALVNAPANYVTPSALAKTAIELAEKYRFEVKILEKAECAQLGMGAYLSVAQGSDAPPKFIHLSYKPQTVDPLSSYKKIALIGKGVTFDSGGLNLKIGAAQIELMKYDMAGAAAVLGAAEAIGALKPNKEIHFIIAATENMINGSATKPGDIVTASNGTTIEIDNTDAEGRLTLADALVYAEQLGVDAIVDLATLTGAVVTALGQQIAGVFGSHQKLVDSLTATTPRTGEKIWQMPLEESYLKGMDSIVADMCNSGKRQGGGSITAALFLKQFIKKTPWAHLDIAGPVWTDKPYAYHNAGATGFGVRLLVDWIINN